MPASNRSKSTTIALLALLAALVYGQVRGTPAQSRQAVDKTTEVCVAVNQMKAAWVEYVDKQIGRAKKTLPTIDYYRKHPVELGKQLALLDRQKNELHRKFAPDEC